MSEEKTELKRTLGLVDATSIVAGSMIGSGIFIVTSQMSRDLGSAGWLLLVWVLTGLITVFAALSYGELAGMMPNAGGQFVYIQHAYGRMISFLYGWTVFTVIQTGVIAAVAVAFAKYTSVFFPELNNILVEINVFKITYAQIVGMASIILLTFINSRGVQNGKSIQLIFTSAKLFALFALIILGLAIGFRGDVIVQNFQDMWNASRTVIADDGTINVFPLAGSALLGAMGATIINSLFSSDAWNNVTFIASEIKDPKKNIPRSLFLGTFIVTIIYILANVAYLALLPMKGNPNAADVIGQGIMFPSNDRVGAAAASVIFGDPAVYIMAVLIMVSTFGCNNGLILAGARLFYAMAKDGLFFKGAAVLNDRQVPAKALWLQCLWACVLCLSGKYGDLLTYATFASLLFYILTIGGIFILRKKEPDTERPYKAFGYPVIPALYIIITSAICIDLLIYDTRNTGFGLLIVLIGIPVYYLTQKRQPAD
ncbi:MAG: putative amino acid-transporting permease [Bacteroidetes bacterium]|jgi:APA family basic amino acid/polyamine antiporter|nr:putative amino acid-transporting permease [Bacteroidota bacterium]